MRAKSPPNLGGFFVVTPVRAFLQERHRRWLLCVPGFVCEA